MSGYLWLGILLIVSPFGICMAQAIVSRGLRGIGFQSIPPQFVALITIAIGNVPVLWLAWEWAPRDLSAAALDLVCGACYILLTYNALAFCYFNVLNASETSLHVHILMTLLIEGSIPSKELTERYNAHHMISARIERMIAFGQLRELDGRFVLSGQAHLVTIGRLINLWRKILGLPLSPQ